MRRRPGAQCPAGGIIDVSPRRERGFRPTSFLYGGNAAYIEDLHARYEANPASVDAEWQAFFESLKDERGDVIKNASGPSWKRPNLPHANGELIAALTGDWSEVEKAVGDKIKAKAQARASRFQPPTCSRRRAIRSTR